MSKEKECKCCHEWWYASDIKEDLCPNCYDYFKQLKQQLAEKEQEFFVFQEDSSRNEQIYIRELAEKQNTIDEINKEFVQAVHDWKTLCDKKDEELRKYKSYKTDDERIKDLTNLYSQYKEENNQLKKELKDKDFALECKERDIKAIERQRDKAYDDYGYLDKISRELGLQNVDYEKQIALLKSSEKCLTERIKNQTQLAIQELEKVNGILTDTIIEVTQNEMDLNKLCYLEEISARFYEKMQEQIKELKGEKDAE